MPRARAEIVEGAWDFARINQRYQRLMRLLDEKPDGILCNESAAKSLLRWASLEREAWLDAVSYDPLLPRRILPTGYLGQKAWQQRVEVLRLAGEQIKRFGKSNALV